MESINAHVRTFAPEQWGEIDFFKIFHKGTHNLKRDAQKALGGASSHFSKAEILYGLAMKLLPNLQIDEQELNEKGHTAARNGAEFTAVVEEVFTELYSSVECARKVITDIYRGVPKLPTDSTRKFFERFKNGEVGASFPSELRMLIESCDWYEELRIIRDELTHADIGHCSLERGTEFVTYMHTGVRANGSALIVNNVMGRIDELAAEINSFLGGVFNFLNGQLQPTEVDHLCGFFFGRAYLRKLPLQRPLDFHSGRCVSLQWFEEAEGFRCPMADNCGAYYTARESI
ncbi:hypothetical protein Q1W70_01770 [Pseudomonas kielensis]|uniref:hypothetical protein n=1 Tax=Pseudomonas kielensis TaxID=2762577 RepID=UPI00265ECF9B|nr:hypothetical protein [Pseudomonas kielensis]WKL53343.1 hypothetical protein Q1W70_01770 [Pseudomonas kielensis]